MSPEKDILKVLAYFDIFHYPVSSEEIRRFLNKASTGDELDKTLQELHAKKKIFKYDHLYFLHDDPSVVCKRKINNQRAKCLLGTADKIASFLYQFPYVRGVGISGSLSKNVADENADIDFFIITKAERLWIARTTMHLFKKLTFLIGRQHWFCMNYYIDEEALLIAEKNIFTATEVITLLPVCGNGTLESFFEANEWVHLYFPNYQLCTKSRKKVRPSFLKRFLEFSLNNLFGEWLDNKLMRITTKRWMQKELRGKLNMKGNRVGLRMSKHFSKPNPEFFQQKVLQLYASKLKEMEKNLQQEIV